MKTVHVEAYSLFEFCQKVEAAMKDGMRFDFETNAHVPTNYGTYFTAVLVAEVEKEVEKAQEGDKKPRRARNEG